VALCRFEKIKNSLYDLGFNIRKNHAISMSCIELAYSDMLTSGKRDFISNEISKALTKEGFKLTDTDALVFYIN
jgi:hypothetical protein